MKRPDRDQKTAIESWIDERIQFALSGLTTPLEKRIARIRERILSLQERVQRISDRIDADEHGSEDAPKKM